MSRLVACALVLSGCDPQSEKKPETGGDVTPGPSVTAGAFEAPGPPKAAEAPAASDSSPPKKSKQDHATLIAGGDVCLGRLVGQEILKNPKHNPFESVARHFAQADIRFVNLESQLSDQKGETQSPTQKLVFTGPPGGAETLALAKVDIVSLANNHMWDYGQSAFFQTLDNLERAKVRYAGAGRTRNRAYSSETVDVEGLRVAFLAFTDIWNQGALKVHPAKDHVAEAGAEAVKSAVTAARARSDVDFVVVSYHGGEEYVSAPLQRAVDLHHAAVDSGADAVIGHHPHVAQGVELYRNKPIFYSLGNFVMRTHRDHASTEIGFLAKVTLTKGQEPEAWICPFRIAGVVPKPIPLVDDTRPELYERVFRQRIREVQGAIVGAASVGATSEDGCAKVGPHVKR